MSNAEKRAVYYTGNHPYLKNTEGVAWFDSAQNAWLYRPDEPQGNRTVYRVWFKNLETK